MVGFANSIGMIILGRAVQGMGAAMSSPATLSIFWRLSPERHEVSHLEFGEQLRVSVVYLVPCWVDGLQRT